MSGRRGRNATSAKRVSKAGRGTARGGRSGRGARSEARATRHDGPRAQQRGDARQRPAREDTALRQAIAALDARFRAATARSVLAATPRLGQWLLATREGSETDLIDELRLLGATDPTACALAPGLVLAPAFASLGITPSDLSFARQGFEIGFEVDADNPEQLPATLQAPLTAALRNAQDYALHVWVADSRTANPLAARCVELRGALNARIAQALPGVAALDDAALRRQGSAHFTQVCLLDAARALGGVLPSDAALSLAPGGRTRVRVAGDLPSRAARKLVEALAWLGMQPGPEELCVDLGAAPGGWCYVLTERRARVIAVDPAQLRPDIAAHKGVRHVQQSAFTFSPDEPVDWLFCDMAWRPLEVAALLAKWGRRRWTRMLVANIKLPMKKKAEILARIRYVLEREGGYRELRMRQLYHDRDEVTLTARVV